MPLAVTPEQKAKADAILAELEARRKGLPTLKQQTEKELRDALESARAEIEELHWQLHCERRRADAACARAKVLKTRFDLALKEKP